VPVQILANWVPDPTPDFGADPKPFIAMMLVGFAIGIFGHVIKSRTAVALGIGLIFVGTLVLPLGVFLAKGG
jgi:hypothetical protein